MSKRHGKARRTATPSGGFTKGSAIYAVSEKDVCVASKSNRYSVITQKYTDLQGGRNVYSWGR